MHQRHFSSLRDSFQKHASSGPYDYNSAHRFFFGDVEKSSFSYVICRQKIWRICKSERSFLSLCRVVMGQEGLVWFCVNEGNLSHLMNFGDRYCTFNDHLFWRIVFAPDVFLSQLSNDIWHIISWYWKQVCTFAA